MRTTQKSMNPFAVVAALGGAVLFGASTPFAKQLVGAMPALLLAGLLYLGAGIGLVTIQLIRDKTWRLPRLLSAEWRAWSGTIIFGGMLGPILLMFGLGHTSAGSASLLLNLEATFTALLAWIFFRENAGGRVILGMTLIIAGGIALSWPTSEDRTPNVWATLLIASACLSWAIDNNLTRKISTADPLFLAGSKGLVAGTMNTLLAFGLGASVPSWNSAALAMTIGFFGYGISLCLIVLALRGLGAARTSAYFSTAPAVGVAFAVLMFGESPSIGFWIAATLMATGVWLHLTEYHAHQHTHEVMTHTHSHLHDEHHRHEHDFPWNGEEPHAHPHRHEALTHSHPHHPDIHHRHRHKGD